MIQKFTPRRIFITLFVFFIRVVFILQVFIIFLPKIFFRMMKISFSGRSANPFKAAHQDVFKHQSDVVKLDGFQIQQYEFETPDHAFVSFWRVNKNFSVKKNAKSGQQEQKIQKKYGQPVIIQHGFIDSSITWFLQQNKDKCLPYVIAAQGYDVWVGNNRGTKFSNRNSNKPNYWDYSIDQLIEYDFPTLIEGVLKVTGKKQLTYIGHSQGTYQFFVGLGVHPKLKYKIKRFIALGPVVGVKHIKNHPLIQICSAVGVFSMIKIMGFRAVIMPQWMSKLIGVLIYNTTVYLRGAYQVFLWITGSPQIPKIDQKRFGFFLTHQPGGASVNNGYHWFQCYKNKRMAKYDFGVKKNKQIYGSNQPPQYKFDHMKFFPFKCYLFKGSKDVLVSEQDFKFLIQNLTSQKTQVFVLDDYAHLDYIWCNDANQDIYQKILKKIEYEQYGQNQESMQQIFQ